MPWGNEGRLSPGWTDPSASRPAWPHPAPLRRPAVRRLDPTRPWYVRVLDSTGLITTAPGSADLAQNPVRKGHPVQGARSRELCATRYRQRDYSVQLYYIRRRTPAGALDAHLWCAARLLAARLLRPAVLHS